MIYNFLNRSKQNILPKASEVLNCYLKQHDYPYWTAYFVKYKDVVNDQFYLTCFVNKIDDKTQYLILRTGCFPFIKYHCSKLKERDMIDDRFVKFQNNFFNFIKLINFGMFDITTCSFKKIFLKNQIHSFEIYIIYVENKNKRISKL